MKIKIGDAEYKAEFNAFTPIAYSRCFTVGKPGGSQRPKDINEAVGQILSAQAEYGFPPAVPLLEILYACIKTADPKFGEGFDEWAAALPVSVYDLEREGGWSADVMRVVADNFFPSSSAVGAATADEAAAPAA